MEAKQEVDAPVVIEEGPFLPEVMTDRWVEKFEKGVETYKRFQVAAFRLTNASHWIRQGDKYFLQGPGAEALMNPLGINFDQPTFRVEDRKDGEGEYFIVWCEGYVESRTLGRRGFYLGSCDSRDQFFAANEKLPRPMLEQNVRKSAYTNWSVNAVSRLAGIMNPDEKMLRAAGIEVGRVVAARLQRAEAAGG